MNPVSSSLFHFTKKKEAFWGILKNLPRYSYSVEPIPGGAFPQTGDTKGEFIRTFEGNKYQIIPMICFCDIPITRAAVHSKKYGEYVFGFDRNTLLRLTSQVGSRSLNPLFYYNDWDAKFLITKVFNNLSSLESKEKEYISRFFGMFKPFSEEIDGKTYSYYDEREWRLLSNDNMGWGKDWIKFTKTLKEGQKIAKECNANLYSKSNAVMGLNMPKSPSIILAELVTHIIVKKECQISKVVNYILNEKNQIFYFNNVSLDTRRLLASRVMSMERIKKDF